MFALFFSGFNRLFALTFFDFVPVYAVKNILHSNV